MFWQSYLNLENQVIEVSKFIFITDTSTIIENGEEKTKIVSSQLKTYSPYISDLILNCCVQIEAISKEIYLNYIGHQNNNKKTLYFDTDCLKFINDKRGTSSKKVLVVSSLFDLTKSENNTLTPLCNAHRRGGSEREKSYQAIKHDRFNSLPKGNVKMLLHSMAALFLLNIYNKKKEFFVSFIDFDKIDFSFGSRLFKIVSPKINPIINLKHLDSKDSPYEYEYKETDIKKYLEVIKQETMRFNNYIEQQPENNDQNFLNIFKNPNIEQTKFNLLIELSKYRLNKTIAGISLFNDKRSLLLDTEQFNELFLYSDKIKVVNNMTEDNLGNFITKASTFWAKKVYSQFYKSDIDRSFFNLVLKIYIP